MVDIIYALRTGKELSLIYDSQFHSAALKYCDELREQLGAVLFRRTSSLIGEGKSYTPMSLLYDASYYKELNAVTRWRRHIALSQNLTKSDNTMYMRSLITEKLHRFTKKFSRFSETARLANVRNVNEKFAEAADLTKMYYMKQWIDNPETLLRKLLFEGGVTKLSMQRYSKQVKREDLYSKLIAELQGNLGIQAAGIGITESEGAIYFYLKNSINDYDVIVPLDGAKYAMYNGKRYEYFAPSERYITTMLNDMHNELADIDPEFIDVCNDMLNQINRHNSNFIGNSKYLDEYGYMDIIKKLPKDVQKDMFSAEELIKRNSVHGMLYNNIDMSIEEYKYHNYYNDRNAFEDIMQAYKHHVNTLDAHSLIEEALFSDHTVTFETGAGKFFEGCSDEDILKIFDLDNAPLAIVRVPNNSQQGYMIRQLPIVSLADVKRARELGAVLVPYEMYSTIFEVINNNPDALPKLLTNKWLKGLSLAYKVGYLMTPGAVIRNIIDSNLKALIDTGSPIGMAVNTMRSQKYHVDYNRTLSKMYDTFGTTNLTNTQILKFYSEKAYENVRKNAMDKDTFFLVKGFFDNGPAAGEAYQTIKQSKKYKRTKREALGQTKPFYESYVEGAGYLLKPMQVVESNVRLAQYLTLIDQGVLKSDAFKRVSDTAFDYALKDTFTKYAEYIIPFFNFKKLNFMYWLTEIDKHPMLFRSIMDYMTAAENSFDIDDQDEKWNNLSLQYHLQAGNIAYPDAERNFVLKTNPSYVDALNTLLYPTDTLANSLWAPLKALIPPAQVEGMLGSGTKYSDDTQSENYFRNVMSNLFVIDNAPVLGALSQRFFAKDDPQTKSNEASTSRKNAARLEDKPVQAMLGKYFPDVFGSVTRWEEYKRDARYRDMNGFYRMNHFISYTKPQRNYNYYTPKRIYQPKHSRAYWYALRVMDTPAKYRARVQY